METLSNQLYQALVEEVQRRLGLPPSSLRRLLLEALIRQPVRRFSNLAERFDQLVGEFDFCSAARRFLPYFIHSLSISGFENIPRKGPLLVLANHPGAVDSLILPACIQRPDLKVVATNIPFFSSLPALRKYLILTPQKGSGRMVVIREVLRHLEAGGAVLIFPSGGVDPDPALFSFASTALERWSESVSLFLRKAPQSIVQIAVVSGVVARQCIAHPLTYLGRNLQQRQLIAEFIQIMGQMMHNQKYRVDPRVWISEPFEAWRFMENAGADLMGRIIHRAKAILERQAQFPEHPYDLLQPPAETN
jgi:hypothetical protein